MCKDAFAYLCPRILGIVSMPSRQQSGFTLIELLVTMTVLLIFITLGIPSFSQALVRHELQSASLSIRQGLHIARSESVKRSGLMHICSLATDIQQCAGTRGVGRTQWARGMLVFHDVNRNKQFDQGLDQILYVTEFPDGMSVEWGRGDYLAYASSGRLKFSNGTFRVVHSGSGKERRLVLNRIGRVRSTEI